MKHKLLMVLSCIMIAFCIIGCNEQSDASPTTDPAQQTPMSQEPVQETASETIQESVSEPVQESEPSSEVQEPGLYGIGEPARKNDVTVTLVDVEENTGDGVLYIPKEGYIFLLCHFDIENNSNTELSISDRLSFKTYVDDYEANLFTNASMLSTDGGFYKTIEPGRKVKGVVGYEVPQDWGVLEITYTAYLFIDDKLTPCDGGPAFRAINNANSTESLPTSDTLEAGEIEQGITLNKEDVLSNQNWELTYLSSQLTTELLPDVTSGGYTYYDTEDDQVFADVVFNVKNISVAKLKLENIVSFVEVTYNEKYTYSSYGVYYSSGSDISVVNPWDGLEALEQATLHIALKIPREALSNSAPIKMELNILGEKRVIHIR